MTGAIEYVVFLGVFVGVAVGLLFGLRSAKII
ncbi:cytochrome b6-f complex subunit PetL [Dolichospermum sp. ST_con]|nr:cytochrome b6-f complex subunit PetL [Dolichospermum sp. ST_con]MDD1419276.1 cytochrome b6-f complex subunit PetL [Dolichospermum sp. ST_sed1]MDD1431111.1 cytochrome b6-f complex subunit PetL [Dolichospermum sp. ST_sed6]MDD1437890.1 cytochrome b6-f complex subunit PetL [Dolichospermum sp. ST_sed10]MDD1441746.1 cytochrome b6-f complex subunit PetL [Dolichospermum sp. ST_sed3]MDD1447640.1 cytochrome b6-f complex subunit PetL [Dolichospermum sp. ST_sed8]MDD1457651.1 cytochrome b6-f complex su